MTDVRWIGRQGEKIFSLKCSRAKITCNQAEEDDCGWDFIIRFPSPTLAHIPIDQRSSGISALVQVKATGVDAKRWSISLQNALSLVNSPLPAFIVRIGIASEEREIFRAVHLWRPQIERILAAARKAYVEGDEAMNHRTISFDFGPETERSDILGWIRSEVETIGERSYASLKQALLDTIGFEDGHGIANIRFSTADPDALLDLQLGLRKRINLEHFSFTPQRFGILASRPEIELSGGSLEIIPKGRTGTLRLRAPDSRQIFLPAEILTASVPGRRRTKVRVKAGCIDMVIKTRGQISVKAAINPNERVSLDTLAAFALLRRSQRSERVKVSLSSEDQSIDLGYLNMNDVELEGWKHFLFITDALKRLVVFENAPPLSISLNAIRANFRELNLFEGLFCDRALRLEYTPADEVEEAEPPKKIIFLSYTDVILDHLAVGVVASRPVLVDQMIADRRRMDMGPATILHASISKGAGGTMRDLYLDEVDRLSSEYDVLAIGDFQKCVSDDADRTLTIDRPRVQTQKLTAAGHGKSAFL